jgi:arylsulfatase A-like enzyme
MVLNIDLAPTLLEFAGVPIPSTMQGKSWVPLLENKSTSWRKSFLAEYFYERPYTTTPTVLALRTDTTKLITYPGHDQWTELFDLARDPYEIKNLVHDPASQNLLEQMKSDLEVQIKAASYRVPPDADKPEADGAAPTKKKRKKKANE